jgi:hypothetical protein
MKPDETKVGKKLIVGLFESDPVEYLKIPSVFRKFSVQWRSPKKAWGFYPAGRMPDGRIHHPALYHNLVPA